MSSAVIRAARPDDRAAAYYVCLKTGDNGRDGEALYHEDPDALGRIYVGPYLAYEPDLSLVLEDQQGVCGYALAAFDSRAFYARYEQDWRPELRAKYPAPTGDSAQWAPVQHVHHAYHHPDYYCPEPYERYPSHLHIDLLPRAQGHGHGRRLIAQTIDALRSKGSPGVHLGVSTRNPGAQAFYQRLGFTEVSRTGTQDDGCIYMAREFNR